MARTQPLPFSAFQPMKPPRLLDGRILVSDHAQESPPGAEVTGTTAGSELVSALEELSSLMLATEDLEERLTRVAMLASSSIGTPVSCAITLQPDGRAITVATSDAWAAQLDELQYTGGEGPCLESMREGKPVSVPDTTVETRWGNYPTHVLAAGVRSSLSMPLMANGQPVGALNLYASEMGVFTPQRETNAAVFAASASGAIAIALRLSDQVQLTEQLRTALSSRSVIDQAIGILIRDRRCSADEAFDVLRAASQRRNVKLRIVAREMVTAMSRKPRPGEPH